MNLLIVLLNNISYSYKAVFIFLTSYLVNPWRKWETSSFAIKIFTLVVVPPLLWVFYKQAVLLAGLQEGYYFMVLLAWLARVIGAVYYLAIIKAVFFYKPDHTPSGVGISNTVYPSSFTVPVSVFTLMILSLILSPELWLRILSIDPL
jgi:NADH-ubiquinone oxidoreductase chain 2